ncbi:hypothetical protein F6W69_10595 [Microbacterium oxydans]|uniref:hypothetical protein n=1 Tax=Microbacterium oxydans TaxID=82380 RepID=UPI0011431E77|nr:hypothetical protein [Microbacterium oxydans]KAB1891037.1 hypothetical protein F6W69_10595 [Microbacterium oxydans]GED39101.1 hypothetical protein MOX01_22430 [Microbacterium oxydans]
MSDVREVNRAHQDATAAVKTDLQRRRELAGKTKPELIDIIRQLETGIGHLTERIDHAYGDEP